MTRTVSLPLSTAPNEENMFAQQLACDRQTLTRRAIQTLQLNLGKMCNLACHHCHVEASPNRTEIMTWETMQQILGWLDSQGMAAGVQTVDLTGGAPEMNPSFKPLVEALRKRGLHVLDRCNLTLLLEPGYEQMVDFLASHDVEIVASLPCYLQENVDKQRGKGVYDQSVDVLRKLNAAGYGMPGSKLRLDLVYNPVGYSLPPAQASLEADYKRELRERFGLHFNRLWTITNMPIRRFEHALRRDGQYDVYMQKLVDGHRVANVEHVMCRELVSVGWMGSVYDCDFNQMMLMPMDGSVHDDPCLAGHMDRYAIERRVEQTSKKLWNYTASELLEKQIQTGNHCFGCTAGHGSSCTGALE